MKRTIILLISTIFILTACSNDKDKKSDQDTNQSKDSQSTEEVNKEVNNDTQQVTAKKDDDKVETFNLNSKEEPLKVDKQANPTTDKDKSSKNDKGSQDGLANLESNAVATTNKQSKQQVSEKNEDQTNKSAKQKQYKNNDPIILVHGFNGFTDDINPSVLTHYWGGDKMNIRQDLEENGYEAYEASISAFGSNYDRAVELYYYIKGGTVDYGAAHAERYGHERYGKTYEGVYKDWQPGQKVHLVGHSMGGQTVRQLEELLRNGSQEEIEYQKTHGGDISPLYKGGQDNMVSTITTLGTPHNGTPAADKLGSTKFIKDTINRIGKIGGTKALDLELGFSQWGFKQQPNESYAEYAKRIANSKVWETEDQAVNDLTTAGAEKLNQMTTLNPNIVYTSYTGAATHTGPLGNEVPNIRQFPLFDLTSRVIGGDDNKNVRVNDGIVPVSSSLHPSDEAFKKVGMMNLATDKGIWQVRPVQYDWDHLDLVGLDTTDYKRTGEELGQFYMSMINNMLKVEELDGITRK